MRLFLAPHLNNLVKSTIPLWYTDLVKLPRRSLATRPFSDCATGPRGRESFRGETQTTLRFWLNIATQTERPKAELDASFLHDLLHVDGVTIESSPSHSWLGCEGLAWACQFIIETPLLAKPVIRIATVVCEVRQEFPKH